MWGQQEIEDLVSVKKGIEQLVLLACEGEHGIGKNAMKSDVLDAKLTVTLGQLGLPVGPQAQRGVSAADRVLPDMNERFCFARKIAPKVWHGSSPRGEQFLSVHLPL
jgi:hypothetical protein